MTNFMTSLLLMTPSQDAQGGGFGQILPTIIMFGGIILVMYFLMIRPQQKRQKEHQNVLNSLKKGDKVITTAGIHGTIYATTDKTFEIQIAENTRITVEKAAIATKKD